jgi:hypothetical protein
MPRESLSRGDTPVFRSPPDHRPSLASPLKTDRKRFYLALQRVCVHSPHASAHSLIRLWHFKSQASEGYSSANKSF